MSRSEAENKGLYHTIGKDIDDRYNEELMKLVLRPEVIKQCAEDIKIVYTPLHGTGNKPVRRILETMGFKNVYVVPEQENPDGNFSTVGYPNPEDPSVFKLGIELAKKVGAEIILATDPDADRLGVLALDKKTGEYKAFTGNMSGVLLCEYQLAARKELGLLPDNGAVVKTIVTTNMADAVTEKYNMQLIEVLTGFKYIGEQIKLFEQGVKDNSYMFGFEESYGCLIGTHARDKDAVVAVMGLCEAAAYCKSQGKTLWDRMLELYEEYGYYMEGAVSVVLKGIEGAERIKSIIENLRNNPISELGGYKVLSISDYLKDEKKIVATGEVSKTGLPSSNVLYYELEDNQWCCVRPSGTEPKLKFYYGIKGKDMEDAKARLDKVGEGIKKLAE